MVDALKNLARQTLQERIYQALKGALMSGEFAPGQPLTIRELAEHAGTSPMPVREAVRRLAAERALEIMPNGTIRVCLMTPEQRAEAREIRIALEGLALRRAAAAITPEELRRLHRLNSDMESALQGGDMARAVLRNQEFHFTIYRAARSPMLLEMIESLWMQNGPFVMAFLSYATRTGRLFTGRRNMPFHRRMMAALRRRDGEAAATALHDDIAQTSVFTTEREEQELLRAVRGAAAEARIPGRRAMGARRSSC